MDRSKAFPAQAAEQNFRKGARAYLLGAIDLYLKNEGRVSLWSDNQFADSANIVCSLNRAIEQLLKLRLVKTDPLLLYPMPKRVQEYCHHRHIPIHDKGPSVGRVEEKEAFSHTISFKEAIDRVELTCPGKGFNFKLFRKIYSLRNSLEHHWDRNEGLLQNVIATLSSKTIPNISQFVELVLEEKSEDYLPSHVACDLESLDKAIKRGHSLAQQRRFERHVRRYAESPESMKTKLPEKYSTLPEEETKVKCPVCEAEMSVKWDWEADYDLINGEACLSGGYPDVKVLFCSNCGYFIEGEDTEVYLPDGFEIEVGSYSDDYYDDYY